MQNTKNLKTLYSLTIICLFLLPPLYSQICNQVWHRFDQSTSFSAQGEDMFIDGNENIFVSASNGSQKEIIKFNAAGDELWSAIHPYPNEQTAKISLDVNGNVIVSGFHWRISTGLPIGDSLWLMKYDPSGNLLWRKSQSVFMFQIFSYPHLATHLTDENGNIYLGGDNAGQFLLIKYTPDGNQLWGTLAGSTAADYPVGIDRSASGQIMMTGGGPFSGHLYTVVFNENGSIAWEATQNDTFAGSKGGRFRPDGGVVILTSTYNNLQYDFTLVNYSNLGAFQSTQIYDSGTSEYPAGFTIDSQGNYYFVGVQVQTTGLPYTDWLVVKGDPNGNILWSDVYNATSDDDELPGDIDLDDDGNLYVTGSGGPLYPHVPTGLLKKSMITIRYNAALGNRDCTQIEQDESASGLKVIAPNANTYYALGNGDRDLYKYGGMGTPICSTPATLEVTSVTTESAFVSWSAVSGAVGYELQYRETGTINWTTISSNTTNAMVSGLSPDVTYDVQVFTLCSSGTSPSSPIVNFTTLQLVFPCSVPENLAISGITSDAADLTWAAVPFALSYQLRYRIESTSSWTTLTSNTNAFSLINLQANTTYEVQVEAICASGTSGFSLSEMFTTQNTGEVIYCEAAGLDASQQWIDLVNLGNINHSSGSDGGYANNTGLSTELVVGNNNTLIVSGDKISSRDIYYISVWIDFNQDGNFDGVGENIMNQSTSSTGNLIALFSVPGNASVGSTRMRVALKKDGYPAPCGTFSLGEVEDYTVNIIQSLGTCEAPTGLSVTNLNPQSAMINWNATAGAVTYELQYRLSGTTNWTSITATINNLLLDGLAPNSLYEVRVSTICEGTNSAFTGIISFTTIGVACAAPGNLMATNLMAQSADLSWNPVASALGYELRYRLVATLDWTTLQLTTTNITLTNLQANSSYEASVATLCEGGNSVFSAPIIFVTLSNGGNTYCDAAGLDASQEWIDLVNLGSINHSSGSDGGYADNTNLSTDLVAGSTNTLNISGDKINNRGAFFVKAWVDFNRDNDFNDLGENIYSALASFTGNLSADFLVPVDAVSGTSRLRVAIGYNGFPEPCGEFQRGEVEDYNIEILPASAGRPGINTGGVAESFSVYPVPSTDWIEVSFKKTTPEVAQLEVIDLYGRVMLSRTIHDEIFQEKLSLGFLPNGNYCLKITANGQIPFVKKISILR